MSKNVKNIMAFILMLGVSLAACGCGDADKVQPQAPTKYVREADETVDEYNVGVDQINKTGDALEKDIDE